MLRLLRLERPCRNRLPLLSARASRDTRPQVCGSTVLWCRRCRAGRHLGSQKATIAIERSDGVSTCEEENGSDAQRHSGDGRNRNGERNGTPEAAKSCTVNFSALKAEPPHSGRQLTTQTEHHLVGLTFSSSLGSGHQPPSITQRDESYCL